MEIKRNFVISCPVFGGFSLDIVINDIESLDEIISTVLDNLKAILKSNNFEFLLEKLENNKSKYHIHDFTIEDILISDSDKIFYICNHNCHSSITDSTYLPMNVDTTTSTHIATDAFVADDASVADDAFVADDANGSNTNFSAYYANDDETNENTSLL